MTKKNTHKISNGEDSSIETKKDKKIRLSLLIALYVLLSVTYIIVAKEFAYTAANFECIFNIKRFILSISLFVAALFLSTKIKDKLLLFIYNLVLILLFMGEAISYTYNTYNPPVTLLGNFLILVLLVAFQNININLKEKKLAKNPMPILLILAIALFIPIAIMYFDKININNILLKDVYETRYLFREETNKFFGYISAPLSRVLLPALIALAIKKKKRNVIAICVLMILFIYLCGAFKSVLFGLIAVLFLYKGSYVNKIRRLLISIVAILAIGIIGYMAIDNISVVTIARRIFFVPPKLGSMYVEYFDNNPTYLSHSPLGLGLTENKYGSSLSMYFGENVLNTPGGNANVGLIAEGFVSFNTIGVIIFAVIISIILTYIRIIKIDKIYAGIILIFIFLMSTSFLSVLLITHGLLFFMVFSYLFMREQKGK